jgi:hypothetical protein
VIRRAVAVADGRHAAATARRGGVREHVRQRSDRAERERERDERPDGRAAATALG